MTDAEDVFPRFSQGELQRRARAMFEVMDAAGVAHLVAYGSERTGSAVQWLSEWPVTREAALVVTPGDPLHLLVQHYNHLPNARRIAADSVVEWGGPSTVTRLGEILNARMDRRTASRSGRAARISRLSGPRRLRW